MEFSPDRKKVVTIGKQREESILSTFSPEQQIEIKRKKDILSSICRFIGKDFDLEIELNTPGGGWHWDFKNNIVRIDPEAMLERPMDELRFIVAHEGGHRRVSRVDFIPKSEWMQPGFSSMMNAIEDPRMNNFIAEAYPKVGEYMKAAYDHSLGEFEANLEKFRVTGIRRTPRFITAGMEYINQWFRDVQGQELHISEALPDDIKEVVDKTLKAAQDSWWVYPSKEEADSSEDAIRSYAKRSYEINRDRVWPEFKKLVEKDAEDQKIAEAIRKMLEDQAKKEEKNEQEDEPENGIPVEDSQSEKQEGSGSGIPTELEEKLTEEEKEELREILKKELEKKAREEEGDSTDQEETPDNSSNEEEKQSETSDEEDEKQEKDEVKQGGPEETSTKTDEAGPKTGNPEEAEEENEKEKEMSESLKQKIKEYVDSLPKPTKQEIEARAKEIIKEIEKMINKILQGEYVNQEAEHMDENSEEEAEETSEKKDKEEKPLPPPQEFDTQPMKDALDKFEREKTQYQRIRESVLPIIDKLEDELRELFVKRRLNKWLGGQKSGRFIDIKRRIQEKAKQVPVMESRAWQKREMPNEKDYAFEILVDLSGSMKNKIMETFKALVAISEVLSRLSIDFEIIGFNSDLHTFKGFAEDFDNEKREKLLYMLREVYSKRAGWNDDGWALQEASKSLNKQSRDEKFLITLSDGQPAPTRKHSGGEFDLRHVVSGIMNRTNQKLIGLGLGEGTEHVESYYPNSLANISVHEMADKLALVLRDAIENYDQF